MKIIQKPNKLFKGVFDRVAKIRNERFMTKRKYSNQKYPNIQIKSIIIQSSCDLIIYWDTIGSACSSKYLGFIPLT